MQSWLVMTRSLTLAGLPRAGAKQSPMMTNKSTKTEQSSEKKGFNGKTV